MSGEDYNTFRKNRAASRNFFEWHRHNPIVVIEDGKVRVFRFEDWKYFEPGRYPGLKKTTVTEVPDYIPAQLDFNDQGELAYECA